MILAKVIGTIVSEKLTPTQKGQKYLLLSPCNSDGSLAKTESIIAIDSLGSGYNDLVMLTQGSSCRNSDTTIGFPIDAMVLGIVDLINDSGNESYNRIYAE